MLLILVYYMHVQADSWSQSIQVVMEGCSRSHTIVTYVGIITARCQTI